MGTAYFIVENTGNILIDCPPWTPEMQSFLTMHGGVQGIVMTHREALLPDLQRWQTHYPDCPIYIQEQEAYLLPGLQCRPFSDNYAILPHLHALWTPGYSPGSTCVYCTWQGGVLFTGRHLLLSSAGELQILRRVKTFHWFWQLRSVAQLRDRFAPETLHYLAPGVHPHPATPILLPDPYPLLAAWDLESARSQVAALEPD